MLKTFFCRYANLVRFFTKGGALKNWATNGQNFSALHTSLTTRLKSAFFKRTQQIEKTACRCPKNFKFEIGKNCRYAKCKTACFFDYRARFLRHEPFRLGMAALGRQHTARSCLHFNAIPRHDPMIIIHNIP